MPHLSFACDAYDGVAMDNAQLRCPSRSCDAEVANTLDPVHSTSIVKLVSRAGVLRSGTICYTEGNFRS
jgi:hypothetical protein